MRSLSVVCARPDVGPQLVEFVGTDDALPRRHLAPASHNHLIETRPSISLLLLQIGNCSSASELRAMTSCAVFFVDLLAGLDPILRRCIGAGADHDTGRPTCKKYLTHRRPLSFGDSLPAKLAFDLFFIRTFLTRHRAGIKSNSGGDNDQDFIRCGGGDSLRGCNAVLWTERRLPTGH